LVQEAIERLVDYDDWFLREVDKGVAAAERSEFVEHADVRKMIDDRYPGSCRSLNPAEHVLGAEVAVSR
jgi:predicted transcriptional regulator